MKTIGLREIRSLLKLLDDPSQEVRVLTLRALVRLPLDNRAWEEVSKAILRRLDAAPQGWSFEQQTLDGIPYRELIEAAAYVPYRSVRERLHVLLDDPDSAVGESVTWVLAEARDRAAVPRLTKGLLDPDRERRAEAARYLSLLDISDRLAQMEAIYKSERDGDTRFWLALALARHSRVAALRQVLNELLQGSLELRLLWGPPWEFSRHLLERGPYPEAALQIFYDAAQEAQRADEEFFSMALMDIYLVGKEGEAGTAEHPDEFSRLPDVPRPGEEIERLAYNLVNGYKTERKLSSKLLPEEQKPLPPEILAALPRTLLPQLVNAFLAEAFMSVLSNQTPLITTNNLVLGLYPLQENFAPDLSGLFSLYRSLFPEDPDQEMEVPDGWPWQVAWVASRADLILILEFLTPALEAEDERQRLVAARFLEQTVLSAPEVGPPVFGGGSAPAGRTPPEDFLDDFIKVGDISGGEIAVGRGAPVTYGPYPDAVDPGEGAALPSRKRVVNTAFSSIEQPIRRIPVDMPLETGKPYYFLIDIGKPWTHSMEETPVDIPSVPARARLTVAIFGFEGNLEINSDADVGELMVLEDGTVEVTVQPLADKAPMSHQPWLPLFFPVRTPDEPGTYRMRCNIYWGQILLQSRLIQAEVMTRPKRLPSGKRALRSILDYALSQTLEPAHLIELQEHQVSMLLNDNRDGTHSLHIYGIDGQERFKNDDVRFRGEELEGMIEQVRGSLQIAAWGSSEDWKEGIGFKYQDGQFNLQRLQDDLFNLAGWGYEFYTAIRKRLIKTGSDVPALENALKAPANLQIAHKESPSYLFPAALIYDYPLDVGADFTLCGDFKDTLKEPLPLEEQPCFEGQCPNREDLKVVCPGGFWGFRHFLGLPLSEENGLDVAAYIPYSDDLKLIVSVATDMALLDEHKNVLRKLHPNLDFEYADTRELVFNALKKSPHLVYFYCHGGLLRGLPYLQVGPRKPPHRIFPSNLHAYKILWEIPRPLVFLNGCHTTGVKPLQALEFVSRFISDAHGAGVIGTEITIFEELATSFAVEFLTRFIKGDSAGQAMRGARLKLLKEGNPLGLAYIPFVLATLHLMQRSR